MLKEWQLQEAKNRFSEVVTEALNSGPQLITRRGTQIAILLSYQEYRKLVASQHTLSVFLRQSPLADVTLDLRRDASPTRRDPDL